MEEPMNELPSSMELAKVSKHLDQTIESRGALLNKISSMDLIETPLNEKMVFVLGLISLGFDKESAIRALNVSNTEFFIWKQVVEHESMLRVALGRRKLIVEERVLTGMEQDPKIAMKLLSEMNKQDKDSEENTKKEDDDILGFINRGAKDRGIILDGEVVQKDGQQST
jgi:hypothetical protein